MTTLARLQAFYWTERLGSLDAAADRLSVTASAIGKRLQELQGDAKEPMFNIVRKGLQLTSQGRELYRLCDSMMTDLAQLEAFKKSPLAGARSVRIGVTELTVMTWFRTFIAKLANLHPDLVVVPCVDLSGALQRMLLCGQLDLAILPQSHVTDQMATVTLGTARFEWICRPGLLPARRMLPLQDLSRFSLIDQGAGSGITAVSRSMLEQAGIEPVREAGSNSMGALIALVEVGLGISCVPKVVVQRAIQLGRLQRIRTSPATPAMAYEAAFLPEHNPAIGWRLAAMARECCNFEKLA